MEEVAQNYLHTLMETSRLLDHHFNEFDLPFHVIFITALVVYWSIHWFPASSMSERTDQQSTA